MTTRAKLFSQLAKSVDASGTITSDGISSSVSLGATVYDSIGQLPMSGYTAGEQAFVKSTSRLYINSGVGWYNVAVINNTPTIQSVLDSDGGTTPFALATDGTATTITITAQDSDGDPLTYTAVPDSDFGGLATVSQASNVFTITPSNPATTSSGTITFNVSDGINIANSLQTFTLNFLSEYWDETVLSIGTSSTNSLDNSTFIDRSANAWGSTVNTWGTSFAQSAFHPYLDNWSVFTDGANDTTTDQTHTLDSFINMGTGDFTIELWCQSYVNADRDGLFNFNSSSTAYKFMFRNATTAEVWELYHTSGSAVTVTYADSANPLNEWVHHAFVRSSGTLVWYINGVAKQTIANHAEDFDDVDIVQVGRYSAGRWPGWISNFRVIKGDAIYTSNFTVPTEPLSVTANTILLLNSGNSFKNRGSLTTTVAISGTILPEVSSYNPFGQGSEYAIGENKGSVSFTTTDGIDLKVRSSGTASTWTIEFWYKFDPTSTINANHYLLDARGTAGSQTAGSLYLYRVNSSTYEDGGSYGVTDANFNDGAWHWLTMVSDGTNRAVWIDGIRIAELGGTRTVGTHLWINSRETNQYHNDCDISDFRFSSTARYATSSTTISVPTSPVGTDGNTTAYYPFDNAGIFDKTGNSAILLSGDTVTSTTYTKYATTSVFTDTGGMLINNVESPLSKDFTYEGWFYPTEVPGSGNALISHGWGGYGVFVFYSSNTSYSLYMSSTGSGWDVVAGEDINVTPWTGSWKHFAFTRSGNTIRVFLDGTQTYTKTISGSLMSLTAGTDDIVGVGSAIDGTSGVHGAMYIENFQIHKNLAKYTSNFTLPTQAQGRTYQAIS